MTDLAGLKKEYCSDSNLRPEEKLYCGGYIEQCVSQTSSKNPAESNFEVKSENGVTIASLDYLGCLGMASFAAISNGRPKDFALTPEQVVVKVEEEKAAKAAAEEAAHKAHEDKCLASGIVFKSAALTILKKVRVADEGPLGIDVEDVEEVINKYDLTQPKNTFEFCAFMLKMKEMLELVIREHSAILAMQKGEQGPIEGCVLSRDSSTEYRNISGGTQLVRHPIVNLDCTIAETKFHADMRSPPVTINTQCHAGYEPSLNGCIPCRTQPYQIYHHKKR